MITALPAFASEHGRPVRETASLIVGKYREQYWWYLLVERSHQRLSQLSLSEWEKAGGRTQSQGRGRAGTLSCCWVGCFGYGRTKHSRSRGEQPRDKEARGMGESGHRKAETLTDGEDETNPSSASECERERVHLPAFATAPAISLPLPSPPQPLRAARLPSAATPRRSTAAALLSLSLSLSLASVR